MFLLGKNKVIIFALGKQSNLPFYRFLDYKDNK